MKAFPTVTTNNEGNEVHCGGMDLRDYFAAKAMQCLVNDWSDIRFDVAQDCYRLADTMMKAREK